MEKLLLQAPAGQVGWDEQYYQVNGELRLVPAS